jgi:energy-coupling factor transporter ATP-binding protein EcfA2
MTTADLDTLMTTWDIPLPDGETLRLEAKSGEVITVVGANGSGKSALATWMATSTTHAHLRRVFAQRKLWLKSSGPSINSANRDSYGSNITHWDRSVDSRYLDHADAQRADITLFDLLGQINLENQRVADLVYRERVAPEVITERVGPRLFDILNAVLEKAGINVIVYITDKQTFVAQHRTLGVTYPIHHMSDGERSALLLAAEVLTAPPYAVVMLDEPERHLHRSISARLIEAVIEERSDCACIVMTHDLDLASILASRPGKTLAALGVQWSDQSPVRWDIREIAVDAPMPDIARRAILGGRRKLLFVEGNNKSLDLALYGALFPEWTVIPTGSCDLVIRNVTGLNQSDEFHWVEAVGVVDGDNRSDEERESLTARNISVLRVSEIENLYYLPQVLEALARKQVVILGGEASAFVTAAKTNALNIMGKKGTLERLARKMAKDEVARRLLGHMPDEVGNDDVSVSFPSPYPRISQELQGLHDAGDYEALVRATPIRDTDFRNQVAKGLDFPSYKSYQRAALVCITESRDLADILRREVADISADG